MKGVCLLLALLVAGAVVRVEGLDVGAVTNARVKNGDRRDGMHGGMNDEGNSDRGSEYVPSSGEVPLPGDYDENGK